jgi:hypothetical protein
MIRVQVTDRLIDLLESKSKGLSEVLGRCLRKRRR